MPCRTLGEHVADPPVGQRRVPASSAEPGVAGAAIVIRTGLCRSSHTVRLATLASSHGLTLLRVLRDYPPDRRAYGEFDLASIGRGLFTRTSLFSGLFCHDRDSLATAA